MTTMHGAGLSPGLVTHETLSRFRRTLSIGLIAFLTLVDLFAAQAILPSLVERFQVSRATMGFAVNASTMGMAMRIPIKASPVMSPAANPPPGLL